MHTGLHVFETRLLGRGVTRHVRFAPESDIDSRATYVR
jgi:hypothetical protein